MAARAWGWRLAVASPGSWVGISRCRVPLGWARPLPLRCLCTPAPPYQSDRTVSRPCMKPHRRDESMKRILVVEDVEFNRDLVVQLLEDTYEVLTAADGSEGICVAEHEHPDLILMDLSLPVTDGWEATRRIKANAALCDIPLIAPTGHAMTGDEERALQSGCNDYLSKPLDEDLLFAKLAKFLGVGE